MKRFLFILITFIPFWSFIHAYEVEYNGLKYEINATCATLIKGDKVYSGRIDIPNEIVYNGRVLPVTEIKGAFKDCVLSYLKIPASVLKMDLDPLVVDEFIIEDCKNELLFLNSRRGGYFKKPLKYVYIGRDIKYKKPVYSSNGNGYGLFIREEYGEYIQIEKMVFGNFVKNICYGLCNCCIIKEIDFGNGIESISNNAFINTIFKSPLIYPESLKKLHENGLFQAPSIILPNSIEIIPYKAFYCCCANNITLGNRTKEIGDQGFRSNNITSIELPSTIERLGKEAFYNCQSLRTVIINCNDPNKIKVEKDPFYVDTYIDGILYVPVGTKKLYQNHPFWGMFFNIQEYDKTSISSLLCPPNGKIMLNNNTIVLEGFSPNNIVRFYNLNGSLIKTYKISYEGCLHIDFSQLEKGIYVLSINNVSYKINLNSQ